MNQKNKPQQLVRVRYAPSPTGFLHIGNARIALFNYLFAHHFKGKFILRTEDTDEKRNLHGSIESQYNNLIWLGIKPDESQFEPGTYGPYKQSERLEIYKKYAHKLVEKGSAYYCFCSSTQLNAMRVEQKAFGNQAFKYNLHCRYLDPDAIKNNLEQNKPYVIRLKVPDLPEIVINDIIRGKITFQKSNFGDWIILRPNQKPTYNFAVAIDDGLMAISHVLRGEDHISNTPYQLMVFHYLNLKPPLYAHISLATDSENRKISKRNPIEDFFISHYESRGYLPNAVINFLALLGWSPAGETEIFDKKTLIKLFDGKRFSSASTSFDLKKLTWINQIWINQMDEAAYLQFLNPFLDHHVFDNYSAAWKKTFSLAYRSEVCYGWHIIELAESFLDAHNNLTPDQIQTALINFSINHNFIKLLQDQVLSVKAWTIDSCSEMIKFMRVNSGFKGKPLMMSLRLICTARTSGPPLKIALYLLGQKKVLVAIKEATTWLLNP